jgi:fibronectin-binding autotransporter adhesin
MLLPVLAACLWYAPNAAGAPTATNMWLGAGSDTYWNDVVNWNAPGVPVPTSLVVFTNFGATGLPGTNGSGAVGTANIAVTNNTSVGQLWFVNTNSMVSGPQQYHTVSINPGVSLTVSNIASGPNSPSIVQVCSQGGYTGQFGTQNGLADQVVYATIQGAGATLNVICTNGLGSTYALGNIWAGQGAANLSVYPTIDPLNAVLDLSGLDNFNADANHLLAAADPGPTPYYFHRSAGTIYLAKTNRITLWAVGSFPVQGVTQGIIGGIQAQNNGGGLGRVGRFFLGYTNAIFCDTGIALGVRGMSGWMGFNPSNAPASSVAYFRNRAGTGRQSVWGVGNRLTATGSNNQNLSGEMDFSSGMVDALVGTLGVGISTVTANTTIGNLEFGSGTIDANVLQIGSQTVSGTGPAQGTVTVSNTAVLKVNTSGLIGGIAGSPGAGSYFGRLIITNGGSVQFANTAPVACGVGSSSEIYVGNGSSLSVFTVGTLSVPLSKLQLSASTLTVDRGTASNPTTGGLVFVNDLDLSGVNTVNMLGPVLVVGQFPIIKYTTLVNGGFINLVLGSTSPGIAGYLSNNVANSSIDFVVTSSVTSVLTWDGQTNSVNVGSWDIGATPNWQGALAYSQAAVPGSLVRFDDTAAGTTTVTFTNLNLAPASLTISNSGKNYTFSGSGALTGPTALMKSGTGSLTIANTGSNAFTGGVFLNDGTIEVGGNGNVLPGAATVTIQDVATAGINMNGLPLTVGALSGAGTTGGNIALGAGTLSIGGGGAKYGGMISGTGKLIKNGSGTQTLTGASTFSGGTFITNSGVVVLNTGAGTGPVNISTNAILQLGDGTTDGAVFGLYITNYSGTLHLKPANPLTLTNLVIGNGSLIKTIGSGATVMITNANPYTGASSVQQGVLQISHPNALGSGSITVGNELPTTHLGLAGNITLTNAITLAGKTGATVPSPVGLNNVSDTNTVTSPITVTGSTCWSVGSDAGKLIVNGTFANASSAALGQFFLRGSAEGVWVSALKDNNATFRLALNKNDSGKWTLTGNNTYTGPTVINEGALVVNGALSGTSDVQVFPGAVLAGTGTISGAVTNSGDINLSGDGVLGALTISSVLFLDIGTTTAFDVSTNGNDSIRGLTNVVYGGTLKVNVDGTLTGNCIFKLFSAQTYGGAFNGFDLPDISPLTWDTSQLAVDGTLRAVGAAVVTPDITHISYGGPGGFFLSGTGTVVAPYDILATTNVALPLINWTNIGGGTFSNGSFLFNDASATNYQKRFYRLTTPTL